MKAEQACRFRLDEGYCVFAKSPGLQPSQEDALGNIFNSTMNNVFPQIGDSILSCAQEGSNVFLARNTLRTDIHGRKTMFTHAYVMNADDYAQAMQQAPMTILGIAPESMLESQSAGAQMPAIELQPTVQTESMEALFAKYNLDKIRYGRLLLGAYQALTGDGSLQLVTNQPLEQTATVVRELTLCILEGLLPMLKGKITFSTGADVRMKISVVCTANNRSPAGDLLFGVEDDRYTNIRPRDEVTELAFYSLGELEHSVRAARVAEMQRWLENSVDVQAGLSTTLVAMAFCLSSDMEMNTDTLLMLFRSVNSAKNMPVSTANQLLTDLVRKLREADGYSTDVLSRIATRYLRQSSPEFRAEADLTFAVAPVDICIALTEAVFQQEMSDNVRQLLKTLLRRIPTDHEGITDQLRTQMVLWILEENEQDFIEYATVLMVSYQGTQKLQLAVGILGGSRDRAFTEAEDAVLANCLHTMADGGYALCAEDTALLDAKCEQYSEKLAENALEYLMNVRLKKLDAKAGLAVVDAFGAAYPQFFRRIYAAMEAGKAPAVWELYQTRACFTEDMDMQAVAQALQDHNTFQNPCGPFETAAAERWLTMAEAEFVVESERSQMSYLIDPVSTCWLGNTDRLALSDAMKAEISTQIALIFWNNVTLEHIYQNKANLDERLVLEVPETAEKLLLTFFCLAIREDHTDARNFLEKIQDPQTTDAFRKTLCQCAQKMLFVLLKEKDYLSWDLALLSCWQVTEKDSGPDMKLLLERCASLDAYCEAQMPDAELRQLLAENGIQGAEQTQPQEYVPQFDVADSVLLADEKLVKQLCRQNIPGKVYSQLVEAIKPERSGFLSNLFKRNKKPEEETQDQAFEDRKKGKKR